MCCKVEAAIWLSSLTTSPIDLDQFLAQPDQTSPIPATHLAPIDRLFVSGLEASLRVIVAERIACPDMV